MRSFTEYLAEASYSSMTFYHGTNSDFDEFDSEMIGRTDPGFIGTGFYLTANKTLANAYAQGAADLHGGEPVVLKFRVRPKKTLELEGTGVDAWNKALNDLNISTTQSQDRQTKELRKLGYDSIAAWFRGQVKEFVVLDSKIAKRVR